MCQSSRRPGCGECKDIEPAMLLVEQYGLELHPEHFRSLDDCAAHTTTLCRHLRLRPRLAQALQSPHCTCASESTMGCGTLRTVVAQGCEARTACGQDRPFPRTSTAVQRPCCRSNRCLGSRTCATDPIPGVELRENERLQGKYD